MLVAALDESRVERPDPELAPRTSSPLAAIRHYARHDRLAPKSAVPCSATEHFPDAIAPASPWRWAGPCARKAKDKCFAEGKAVKTIVSP